MAPARDGVPATGRHSPTTSDDTTELLSRVQQGEDGALDALLGRLAPALERWARGRLPGWARERSETRDLVQETLIGGLRHFGGFEPLRAGALHAYLRQAILNRIRDEVRRVQRLPRRAQLDPFLESHGASPLEEAIGQEALEQYERALSRLRPVDREAIIGRIELGYSFTELALALGKPTAEAARLGVTRAIVRLGAEMQRGT